MRFDRRTTTHAAAILLALAVTLSLFHYVARRTYETTEAEIRGRLVSQVDLRSRAVKYRLDRMREMVLFLKDVPPVQGIVRARRHGGYDHLGSSTEASWRGRLDQIFVAFVRTHPEIVRLRFVGGRGCPEELVRVDREGTRVVSRTRDHGACLGDQPDLARAIQQPPGSTLVLSPRPEGGLGSFGKDGGAGLRCLTAISSTKGQGFGAIELTMTATPLLAEIQAFLAPGFEAYLLDEVGRVLSSSRKDGAGGAKGGMGNQGPVTPLGEPKVVGFSPDALLAVRRDLDLDGDGKRNWSVVMAVPVPVLEARIREERTTVGLGLAGILAGGGLLAYLYLLGARRKLAIGAERAKIAAIVDSSEEGIVGLSLQGTVTSWNPAASELLGIPAETAVGCSLAALLEDQPAAGIVSAAEQVARSGATATVQFEDEHLGELRHLAVTVVPVREELGLNGCAAIVRDVTAQHRSQELARELNERLERLVGERTRQVEAILKHAGSAIVGTDVEGRIAWFNPAATRLLGVEAQQVLGTDSVRRFFHPKELEDWEAERQGVGLPGLGSMMEDAQGRTTSSREWTLVGSEGREIPAHVTVSEVESEGVLLGHLAILTDLTERRRSEEALWERTREAQEASRTKAQFLANMSHEIRTPMNAILGLAQVLERAGLPEAQAGSVRKILRAGAALQTLLDDILDVSKIEAGRLELESVPFRLEEVLDNLATIMGTNLGDKDVELAIDPPPVGAGHLQGDPHRLGQVLINLTGNAIKFTDCGSVHVAIASEDAPPGRVRLRFAVRDTGIGIAPERQASIFGLFAQADSSMTRRFGGTGLGLSISRLLVEKMGGTIVLHSQPGEGSEFAFTVEFALPEDDVRQEDRFAHAEVLVADDSPFSREAIGAVAGSIGWKPTLVESGLEAIRETVVRSSEGIPFDVVLLDWMMPDLDGLETTARLKEMMQSASPPIVLLATAHAREELQSRPEAKLVDGILIKPVTASSLFNAVQDARRQRGDAVPAPQPRLQGRLKGMRILAVDDNETNRDVVVAILGDEGALVHACSGGKEAIEWLLVGKGAADAILMDVQMPGLDGYDTTRALRSEPGLRGIPVVALSAGVLQNERALAREAGMVDFVAKPFRAKELVDTLCRVLGQSRDGAGTVPRQGALERPVLDLAEGLSLWKDEGALKGRLVRFRRDHGQDVREILQGLSQGDKGMAAFSLHRLKGVAGSVGLLALAEAAGMLERRLVEATDPAEEALALSRAMDEALGEIARLVPEADLLRTQAAPLPRPSPQELRQLLEPLRQALASDQRRRAVQALDSLDGKIPLDSFAILRDHVEGFAFREAEHHLEAMIGASEANPPSRGGTYE